jgi:two-component sensor histidine kinase
MSLLRQMAASANESLAIQLAMLRLAELARCDDADLLVASVDGSLELRATTHLQGAVGRTRLGKGVGLAGRALIERRAIIVPDELMEDSRFAMSPGEIPGAHGSGAAIPLVSGGEPAAVVLFRWRSPGLPGWPGVEEIEAEMAEAAAGIRLISLGEGGPASRYEAATAVSRIISSSPYLEEILQLLVTMTAARFDYKVVTVRLLDERRQELILRATQATHKAYQNKRAIRLNESIAGRVLRERKVVMVRDVQTDQDYIGHDLARDQGLRSMICLPLMIHDRPVGVLTCYTGEVREFPDDEVEALRALSQQAAVSIEHAKLQVRTTLMQEMHHRVKNNLQQVASLLRLQIRQSHYKDPVQALTDSLSRILAIASVHEMLSREDLDHVSLKSTGEMLAHNMQQSMIPPHKKIAMTIRGDDVYLNTNQATQAALILNELISNAIEHGFGQRDEGEVHVSIENKNGEIGIWVSNNGEPLPPGFDPSKGQLGLQIISSLSRSLGGSFKIEDRLGWTVAEVKFSRARAE